MRMHIWRVGSIDPCAQPFTHTFTFETVKTFGIDIGTTALTIDSQQEHICDLRLLQFAKEIFESAHDFL